MSGFDDAIAAARRNADMRDQMLLSQQRWRETFTEQINLILADAAQRMREFPGYRLMLVRPKQRFEHATSTIIDTATRTQYVVIDEMCCWPVYHTASAMYGRRMMLLTEHGGLVWPRSPAQITCQDPSVLAITDRARPVDVQDEFKAPNLYGDEPRDPVLRGLRTALAECYVAHERANRF